jgi:hypothetical protein
VGAPQREALDVPTLLTIARGRRQYAYVGGANQQWQLRAVGAAGGAAQINWLVTDHLGTPLQTVADQTGISLASGDMILTSARKYAQASTHHGARLVAVEMGAAGFTGKGERHRDRSRVLQARYVQIRTGYLRVSIIQHHQRAETKCFQTTSAILRVEPLSLR